MRLFFDIRRIFIKNFSVIIISIIGFQSLVAQKTNNDTTDAYLADSLREVYFIVEEMPKFNHKVDLSDFRVYLMENLQFSDTIADCLITTFYISFIIEPSGKISNTEIKMRGSEYCDSTVTSYYKKTLMNVIENAPRFEPGKQRGKAVPVKIAFPLMVDYQ